MLGRYAHRMEERAVRERTAVLVAARAHRNMIVYARQRRTTLCIAVGGGAPVQVLLVWAPYFALMLAVLRLDKVGGWWGVRFHSHPCSTLPRTHHYHCHL